jgi:hypothetical protein
VIVSTAHHHLFADPSNLSLNHYAFLSPSANAPETWYISGYFFIKWHSHSLPFSETTTITTLSIATAMENDEGNDMVAVVCILVRGIQQQQQ